MSEPPAKKRVRTRKPKTVAFAKQIAAIKCPRRDDTRDASAAGLFWALPLADHRLPSPTALDYLRLAAASYAALTEFEAEFDALVFATIYSQTRLLFGEAHNVDAARAATDCIKELVPCVAFTRFAAVPNEMLCGPVEHVVTYYREAMWTAALATADRVCHALFVMFKLGVVGVLLASSPHMTTLAFARGPSQACRHPKCFAATGEQIAFQPYFTAPNESYLEIGTLVDFKSTPYAAGDAGLGWATASATQFTAVMVRWQSVRAAWPSDARTEQVIPVFRAVSGVVLFGTFVVSLEGWK